ncbi:hypothetical protein B0H13DRAFT_2486842 [Mycena leptocephala]|nr:hypothetical protein B0H13DRAFT_2486842 [Mycena leptocephala]
MPDLPQELVDAIVDQVPDSSLGACSLTATAFVTSSQRRLFRWMSLGSDMGPGYERTADLLASSPHLGKYVRLLALDIRDIPQDYVHLKSILPLLPEIERLSIMDLNPCLFDLLSLPTLRCFAMDRLNYIPSSLIVRALASFEQVVLTSLFNIFEDPGADPAPGALRHLFAHEDILPFLLDSSRAGYLKNLERLSVVIPPIADLFQPKFTELLVACSSTLTHLAIELEQSPTYLPTLPGLRSLELWLDVELTKAPNTLLSILSDTLTPLPHLEVLTLAILDRPAGPHRPNRQCGRAAGHDTPDLREVHFSLRLFGKEAERYAEFVPFHPMDRFVD